MLKTSEVVSKATQSSSTFFQWNSPVRPLHEELWDSIIVASKNAKSVLDFTEVSDSLNDAKYASTETFLSKMHLFLLDTSNLFGSDVEKRELFLSAINYDVFTGLMNVFILGPVKDTYASIWLCLNQNSDLTSLLNLVTNSSVTNQLRFENTFYTALSKVSDSTLASMYDTESSFLKDSSDLMTNALNVHIFGTHFSFKQNSPQRAALTDYIQKHCVQDLTDLDSFVEDLSTPPVKLYYPEPFVASPSFVHEDLWFIHILHYQHWLWFMFISLIMFYFITFINVVRWCNIRNKPKRETRGVSRSKCADLITACVPVMWAASIIISESVDAADYYDGFGTGEVVIGIRAYQWGWEYFYPKGVDLNYNVTPSYSSVVGNSLKYNNASAETVKSNVLWKHYQNTSTKQSSTPAHLLLSPSDNSKVVNFMDFRDLGINTSKDSNAFKKIQYFSKTNPQPLYTSVSDFNSRYKKISNLYLNDESSHNVNSYGTNRQNNFTSLLSSHNNNTTLVDKKSVDKYLSYNSFESSNLLNSKTPISSIGSSYSRDNVLNTSSNSQRILNVLDNPNVSKNSLSKFVNYPTTTSLLSSDSDGKQHKNVFKYALTSKWKKKNFLDLSYVSNNTLDSDLSSNSSSNNSSNDFFNNDLAYRMRDFKSPNQQFLTSEKNPRILGALSLGKTNSNLDGGDNSLTAFVSSNLSNSLGSLETAVFNNSPLNFTSNTSLSKLVNNSTYAPTSHLPTQVKNSSNYPLGFSKYDSGSDDLTPELLKSREEAAPNYVFDTQWLSFWAHSSVNHRISANLKATSIMDNSYLPLFTDYAEYDFRNWQGLELLEDAFWESTYSSFVHDDYLNILQNTKDFEYFKAQEELFNLSERHKKFKSSILSRPFMKSVNHSINLNTLPIFTEDSLPNSTLLSTKNFYVFPNEVSVDSLDDTYTNTKYLNYLYATNYKTVLSMNLNAISPLSYTQVLDSFRADYEENNWYFDNVSQSDSYDDSNTTLNNVGTDVRFSNPLKLRSTARSAIVTYNAIQKVFKSRFDEGRSNARLQDFSNSYVSHPFQTEPKSPYESILGKNKESFFTVNNYKQSFVSNFNDTYSAWNSLNVYFSDLPFLVSMKSDPSRYLWFDWQSRWSSIEIQPSSVSRYSLLGVPYSSKNFEYSTANGDDLNDSENYLVRLARARKNYMSNWAFTPYFYARMSNWYVGSPSSDALFNTNDISSLRILLRTSSDVWNSSVIKGYETNLSTPSFSGVNTPGRSSWKPLSGVQSYYYNSSTLVDLLTKREFLYRQYFLNNSYTTYLPKYLTASPNNPLLEEVKAAFPLVDPVTFGSEVSRDVFYNNINFVRFNLFKEFINITNDNFLSNSLNLKWINNYLFLYLFGNYQDTKLSNNLELYKSQFRPMKKGVTNMIRLHATGAIAMPIEIRLHILASSKDVIHSWAIPSAGIKIDCVPGYSSHRVTTFLVSGIFWGQCMEICGRFHHWMPIIVYFMKRDLFFLWCTHFMHYSDIDEVFHMTDRQLSDRIKLVSFDKTSWVHEINKIL